MTKISKTKHVTKDGKIKSNPVKLTFYDKVILDSINSDGYDENPKTNKEKLEFLKKRFESEYGHEIPRRGYREAMAQWYAGLPTELPFYNVDVIKLAKKGGTLSFNATESQEQRVLDNYWNYMAGVTIKLFRKYKISTR